MHKYDNTDNQVGWVVPRAPQPLIKPPGSSRAGSPNIFLMQFSFFQITSL